MESQSHLLDVPLSKLPQHLASSLAAVPAGRPWEGRSPRGRASRLLARNARLLGALLVLAVVLYSLSSA